MRSVKNIYLVTTLIFYKSDNNNVKLKNNVKNVTNAIYIQKSISVLNIHI